MAFLFFLGSTVACAQPRAIVFFDLGNTLITTLNFSDPAAKAHYLAGAREYVRGLIGAGYEVGLISNIPDDWGKTRAEKLGTLEKKIADHWSEASPFEWDAFAGRILLPVGKPQFKPAPPLFLEAVEIARAQSTRAVFIGDDAKEVQAAIDAGMAGFHVQAGKPEFPVNP